MAICILVIEDEEKAYDFCERVKVNKTSIAKLQVIEPNFNTAEEKGNQSDLIPGKQLKSKVKLNEVKLLNPKLSSQERQQNMSRWLMPFGFIAGITFAGMTGLETFSRFGLGKYSEIFAGGMLGMLSGLIGSFFASRSVNSTSPEDLKGISKFNEQGYWLILIETPFDVDPPWSLIKEMNPIESFNLNLN